MALSSNLSLFRNSFINKGGGLLNSTEQLKQKILSHCVIRVQSSSFAINYNNSITGHTIHCTKYETQGHGQTNMAHARARVNALSKTANSFFLCDKKY